MRSRIAPFAAIATAALLTVATVASASAADNARVRVLHGSPDAPAVDVHVDGSVVLSDVPFGTISDYLRVPAGDHRIEVFAAGTTTDPVIDATVPFDGGMAYTVAATNELAAIEAQVLVDDAEPSSDMAAVRAVHFSADAPEVDVAPRGSGANDALVTLTYPNDSGYLDLPADSYDLDVRLAGTTDVALELPMLEVEAGTAYSVFVIGSAASPAVGEGLTAVVAVDAQARGDLPPSDAVDQVAGTVASNAGVLLLAGLAAFVISGWFVRQRANRSIEIRD